VCFQHRLAQGDGCPQAAETRHAPVRATTMTDLDPVAGLRVEVGRLSRSPLGRLLLVLTVDGRFTTEQPLARPP
ncbi:MAG: hypothetical protein MUE31_08215, partial [Candidatus Nanopelagicales bacterium]|nr:hypothetical protein [Candidatus Nanopelagicales bacterium]